MPSYAAGRFARGDGVAVAVRGFTEIQTSLRRIGEGSPVELRRRIMDIGARVALVAGSNAPRQTGDLQHSIKVSAFSRGASVYSTVVYGGAINYGAWTREGRGPHIKRANASHYMNRAVVETAPWVEAEINSAMEWAMTTFQEG